MDLSALAAKAREDGINEVLQLLQRPEDLEKLPDLLQEYELKLKANKSALSNLVQSQVEATRQGVELLDRSTRHLAKLRGCLDGIYKLCEECSELIENQERIHLLSRAHGNIQKVLNEIRDIIDLPNHAEAALAMLDDPANLVAAYQALAVLEGTAENAKLAWKRNAKAVKHDMSSLMQYIEQVGQAVAEFEAVLFDYLADYEQLAQDNPTLLVDCLQCVELQERVDKQYTKTKVEGFPPKRWKQRLLDMMAKGVSEKFANLLEEAPLCGVPNRKVQYTPEGDIVTDEKRDYLGNLTSLTLLDKQSGTETVITDGKQLKTLDIIEEEVFDEEQYLDAIVPELYEVESDLAVAYDLVTPCFPPSYNIFETLFQMYHIQVAQVIDTIGQRCDRLSTKGALRVMEFVRKYMETLRSLGVDEALVRLPVSPNTNPDLPPGLDMLMRSYIDRMQRNVTQWYSNIMVVDLEYEPKEGTTGKLRTPGVTDFFRILHEEMELLRGIDDHGEVMFNTARMALQLMRGFQAEQTRVIQDVENVLSFEMFCALLNNNVACYEQSLEFVEEVQEQLEDQYQGMLEVEEVCRGFLEVAKEAGKRVVGTMFNDPGMSSQLKALFTSQEWLSGRTTGILIATLEDYMNDVQRFVEDSFVKRVAEIAFEELVRRTINMFIAGVPPVTDALVMRMQADEDAYTTYFSQLLKPDKMAMPLQQLSDLRLLVSSDSISMVVSAYESVLTVHHGVTLDVLSKILDSRGSFQGWDKKQVKDVLAAAKEVWKAHNAEQQESASKKLEPVKTGGFFSFFGGS